MESSRFGKPVFISNNTSLPEVGGTHAFYWDQYDPEYMATILQEGLAMYFKNQEALSKAYIEHTKQFSWARAAQHYIDVYKSLTF